LSYQKSGAQVTRIASFTSTFTPLFDRAEIEYRAQMSRCTEGVCPPFPLSPRTPLAMQNIVISPRPPQSQEAEERPKKLSGMADASHVIVLLRNHVMMTGMREFGNFRQATIPRHTTQHCQQTSDEVIRIKGRAEGKSE
jgi:hypothetical protein